MWVIEEARTITGWGQGGPGCAQGENRLGGGELHCLHRPKWLNFREMAPEPNAKETESNCRVSECR